MIFETLFLTLLSLFFVFISNRLFNYKEISDLNYNDWMISGIFCFILAKLALSSLYYLPHYLVVIAIYWMTIVIMKKVRK